MSLISLKNAGYTAVEPLFEALDLVVGPGDRLGIVAGNGRGKTTLLGMMCGEIEPSHGDVTCSRGAKIGFVRQQVPANLLSLSVYEAVRSALPASQRDSEMWRVDVVLDSFGFPAAFRTREVSALSGGWQRMVLIAYAWVAEPDILLLDEPTNHLDLTKIFQLENWLAVHGRGVPLVVASHDRAFLDSCTNKTLFVRPQQSQLFSLPYSQARRALDEADEAMAQKHERSLKEAQRLRRQAAKLKNIGINSGSDLLNTKTKQLKARAARIEEAAVAAHRETSGDIQLANRGTHAKVLVHFDNADVLAPDGAHLFKTGDIRVFQGDRIVVLGHNGAGKSQLVRLLHNAIAGEANTSVRATPSIVLGYMDQDLSQLSLAQSPMDIVAGVSTVGDQRARALLANAGFAMEQQSAPLSQLSLGQRSRLALLAIRLAEPNFYLLDEPTNHVDIDGQEALEAEILKHEATCVLVSHDRSFVRAVGTRFWQIDQKRLVELADPESFFKDAAELPTA